MHALDWGIVVTYLAYVIYDGVRRSKGTHEIEGYIRAHRTLPWWAVGLSVMATQLSAITLVGTTGQGATDGMRFIQFYLGLPLAMVILGVTLVPFLHRSGVYTAYELLERRFGPATRAATAFLFLLSRGASCGVIIAAPAVILSTIFGWSLWLTVAVIGLPTVIYTMIGGVQAVTWVDVKQMVLIVCALLAIVIALLVSIPVSPGAALRIAGSAGRLRAFDFSFSLRNQYTVWSGLIGGTFLMLSYFGTDQSQVQRYLTARSVDEARSSLLLSAYWKIPLQALVLLVGVLVFVYYLFTAPPLFFNPQHDRAVREAVPAAYVVLQNGYQNLVATRADAAALVARDEPGAADHLRDYSRRVDSVRVQALGVAARVTGQREARDVNYVIPRFVLDHLPVGLVGLFIAAVMAAAMQATAGELSALSTATVIDLYRRWIAPGASDATLLRVSKGATAFWGLVACSVAVYAVRLGSLIEVVNRFGSFFYGSILGVFVLAMIPRARPVGAFLGLVAGMAAVGSVSFAAPWVAFLWLNVVGVATVVIVGLAVSLVERAPGGPAGAGARG